MTVVPETTVVREALHDGSHCEFTCPPNWNGYLITQPDLWFTTLDEEVQRWLHDHGFASVRHSRDVRQWDVAQGLRNQDEAIRRHAELYGMPSAGIVVWGGSMGGLITRLLIEKDPDRYAGAVPMDGGGAGTLATFDRGLDMAFVITTLIAADQGIRLIGASDPASEIAALSRAVETALQDPAGRARLALAAAVGGMPAWSDPTLPRPDAGDPESELDQLARGLLTTLPQAYGYRVNLEQVVGGVFVSNEGVDYTRTLIDSGDLGRVQQLYDIAGISLEGDLSVLADTPRITADPAAISQVTQDLSVDGRVSCPVLVLKAIGDPDAVTAEEHTYAASVRASGAAELVRWAWVDTPGHLNFTVAERITALTVLLDRIRSGGWGDSTTPAALTRRAEELAADDRYDFSVYFCAEKAPGKDFGRSRFVPFSPRPYGGAAR